MKKGQFSPSFFFGVVGVVVALIFIGVVLATSFKSIATLRDIADNKITNTSNESISFSSNNTAIALKQLDLVSGSEKVMNGSGNLLGGTSNVINKGRNYTINYGGGTISFLNESETSDTILNNTRTLLINYSYYIGSQERNITKQNQEGIKTFSDFQPTFGTVVAVAIVMLILISLTAFIYKKME